MNESPGETVGVVGPDGNDAVERAVSMLEETGRTVDVGDAETVADSSDLVVAVGESALLSVARAGSSAAVLPVDAGRGVRSVLAADLERAMDGLSDRRTVERSLLSVTVAGESVGPALFDVTLTTTEPARISEYSVSSGTTTVADFRADAVVAATPAGSQGYARNADGPVVAPDLDAVTVVPVAPFAIALDRWVLDLADSVRLAVEREEVPVTLLVDDREIREVGQDDPIEITTGGTLTLAVVPESQPFFEPS